MNAKHEEEYDWVNVAAFCSNVMSRLPQIDNKSIPSRLAFLRTNFETSPGWFMHDNISEHLLNVLSNGQNDKIADNWIRYCSLLEPRLLKYGNVLAVDFSRFDDLASDITQFLDSEQLFI